MNKAYKETMQMLHFSQEQKEKMVDCLMCAQEMPSGAHRKHRSAKKRTVAAVLAAAAVVLTMGAGAIHVGLASDAFASVFGTMHTEIIDKIGKPVGASDSDAGITVTVDAILGDKHNLNVVFTMEKENGSSWGLDSEHMLMVQDELELGYMGGSHGTAWVVDENPEDSIIQYVRQITVDQESGIPMGYTKATLKELCVYNTKTEKVEQEIQGEWKIRFDLRYEDSSISLIEQPFSVETAAGTVMVEEVKISPVGFRVRGHYEDVTEDIQHELADYQAPESGKLPENTLFDRLSDVRIVLYQKDGNGIELSQTAGRSVNLKNKTFIIGDSFSDNIYNLTELEAIEIAGVILPIRVN